MSLPPEILIESELHTPAQLQTLLTTHGAVEPALLQTRTNADVGLRIDPVTLTAIIAGSAQLLAAVITGVLTLMAREPNVKPGTVRIVLRDHRTIEVPVNTSVERMRALVNALEGEEPVRVLISSV